MAQAPKETLLESFLKSWPLAHGENPALLRRLAREVSVRWAEIKRAYSPGEPAGTLADLNEMNELRQMIIERTHLRMVRRDDSPDTLCIYLPGTQVPVTPVESLVNPIRRLLDMANSPSGRVDNVIAPARPRRRGGDCEPIRRPKSAPAGVAPTPPPPRPPPSRVYGPTENPRVEELLDRISPILDSLIVLQKEMQRKVREIKVIQSLVEAEEAIAKAIIAKGKEK